MQGGGHPIQSHVPGDTAAAGVCMLITTGAGDHFNSGFCLGKLLGFENAASVLMGVTASGYYVRSAQSPTIDGLVQMLRNWPTRT